MTDTLDQLADLGIKFGDPMTDRTSTPPATGLREVLASLQPPLRALPGCRCETCETLQSIESERATLRAESVAAPTEIDAVIREQARVAPEYDGAHREPNHYDWFMPENVEQHVDGYLDDLEAKLRQSLSDFYVHDMAMAVLPLIAAYREAKAARHAPPALDAAPDKRRIEAAIDDALSQMDDEWLTSELADAIAANLRSATPASGEPAATGDEEEQEGEDWVPPFRERSYGVPPAAGTEEPPR